MKKTLLIGAAVVSAFSLSAQQSVLKDAEHEMKGSSPDYNKVLNMLQPALTNPETAELAETWNLAGDAAMNLFSNVTLLQATGQTVSPADQDAAGLALLNGFNYSLKALPLDTVVNEKGKVKTKYSKDIVKRIQKNYEQLRNAGIMAWSNADYDGAYDIWEMYLTLPTNPVLGKNAPKAAADTIQGELMWNQAIARLLKQDNAGALKKIRQMEGYGFMPEDYYAYAMTAAKGAGDDAAANEYARKGLAQGSGESNVGFLAQLINTEIDNKNYPAAYEYVNQALSSTPESNGELRAQLYDIIGSINETEEKFDDALTNFKKAIDANPNFGKAYFDYGRIVYNEALKLDDTLNDQAERDAKVNPKLIESAEYFEKAYELDNTNTQIPNILYRLYYRLGAGYEDKASYWQNQ